MKVANPLCPKCGCPARTIIGVFKVHLGVTADKAGYLWTTGEKRVGQPVGEQPLMLECGGKHQWTTTEITT